MDRKLNSTTVGGSGSDAGVGKKSGAATPMLRDVGKLATAVASGSATGNPRNKCALEPGHSLMDWIRLGQSGRDLTGIGSRAGTIAVGPRQLAQHSQPDDAWVAIRGKVYNITHYLSFHPGGAEELMKGAGKDATALFNEIHPWVNYESILQKCLIGRLSAFESDVDVEALFNGTETLAVNKRTPTLSNGSANISISKFESRSENNLTVTSSSSSNSSSNNSSNKSDSEKQSPRFDWIQKMDYITVIFYTKAFCNPQLQVLPVRNQKIATIHITYDNCLYTNHLHFTDTVHNQPTRMAVSYETGKIELHFRKIVSRIWMNYGELEQQTFSANATSVADIPVRCKVVFRRDVNYNTCITVLRRDDDIGLSTPLGKHIRVYGEWNGQQISRSYTPIPWSLVGDDPTLYTGNICLLIKKYPDGKLSPVICSKDQGDYVHISTKPLGAFNLRLLETKDTYLLLAAGTGITPMLGVLAFVLARVVCRCLRVTLLFFNRKEEDILCREKLDKLQKDDPRFAVEHILSEPSESWSGGKGHVSDTLLKTFVDNYCEDNHLFPSDIFVCVCGPTPFANQTQSILKTIGYQKQHMHCFLG